MCAVVVVVVVVVLLLLLLLLLLVQSLNSNFANLSSRTLTI